MSEKWMYKSIGRHNRAGERRNNTMMMKLNTKIIKDSLIESIIRDTEIVRLLDNQSDNTDRVHELINDKIFTYLKRLSFNNVKTFICVDVEEYKDTFKVLVRVCCHEDLNKDKDSYFYNKVDTIAEHIKENVNNVFPKATGYKNIPYYGDKHIVRNIMFYLNHEDECHITYTGRMLDTLKELRDLEVDFLKSTIINELSTIQVSNLVDALRKYVNEEKR